MYLEVGPAREKERERKNETRQDRTRYATSCYFGISGSTVATRRYGPSIGPSHSNVHTLCI